MNFRGHFAVPLKSFVHSALRLVDGVLSSLALLQTGGVLLRTFALAALLLPLEGHCGLAVGRLVGSSLRRLSLFSARRCTTRPLRAALAGEMGRELGVFLERATRPDRTLQNDAGRAIVAATTSGSSLSLAAP